MPQAQGDRERRTPHAWMKGMLKRLHAPVYASRIQTLARCITPHLREGDRVLDVGCGSGLLGRAILDAATCPPRIRIHGVEQRPRGHEPIDVQAYDGLTIPYGEKTYDVVILADVLHHADEPDRLMIECIRVSKRLLIIKDHQVKGLFARQRLVLLDWVANAPFGVPCLYRFWTAAQWTETLRRHRLTIEDEVTSMGLYPFGLNRLFGGGLHYFVVLRIPGAPNPASPNQRERSVSVSA